MSQLAPAPTSTAELAPVFKVDPIGWQLWYLEQNLHLYHEFRRRADEHAAAGKVVRANRIVMELRFDTQLEGNDAYKVNDHANPFFVRVYKQTHPKVPCEYQKKGYWKDLSEADCDRIKEALKRLQAQGKL